MKIDVGINLNSITFMQKSAVPTYPSLKILYQTQAIINEKCLGLNFVYNQFSCYNYSSNY